MIARLLAVIVVHAAVQAALVLGDPVPGLKWGFALIAALSFAALVAALWAITAIISGNRESRLLAYTATVILAVAATTIIVPILVPVGLVVGIVLISAVAAQVDPIDGMRRRPGRATLAAVVSLIAMIVVALATVGLGFLVTGVPSAALTWLLAGSAWAALIALWRRVWVLAT